MRLEVSIKKKLVNFELQCEFTTEDEIFALLGASGCGKSMTLKCIAGIETPDRGFIRLGNTVLFDSEKKINVRPQERHIGYLFQNYALFTNMTVAENIAFTVKGTKAEKKCLADKYIERFSLNGLENSYPDKLSGGQQQRTAFARMLASNAQILLLDEPFSALDEYLKWQMELDLRKELAQYNGSALFVSHNRGEVYRLCSRIAVMNQGRIEAIKMRDSLFRSPDTLMATILSGCKNISTARRVSAHTIYAEEWQMELQTEDIVPPDLTYVGIRAHNIHAVFSTEENAFEFTVHEIIEDIFAFNVIIRRSHSDGKTLYWIVEKKTWERLCMQKKVYLTLPKESLIMVKR